MLSWNLDLETHIFSLGATEQTRKRIRPPVKDARPHGLFAKRSLTGSTQGPGPPSHYNH